VLVRACCDLVDVYRATARWSLLVPGRPRLALRHPRHAPVWDPRAALIPPLSPLPWAPSGWHVRCMYTRRCS